MIYSRHEICPEPVFVNVYGDQESISPTYVACRAGKKNKVVVPACQAGDSWSTKKVRQAT